MTEPGADLRARGGTNDRLSVEWSVVCPDPDDEDGECFALAPLCTRAELWAAIEALESCSYDEGYDEGAGDPSVTGATRAAKDRVRALLGLEPEG